MEPSEILSRDFKGIWIPKEIWLHPSLSWAAKGLWAEIDSLYCEEKGGCYASDEYFEAFLGVKRTRLHEVMKELTDLGFLEKVSCDGRRVIRKAISPKPKVSGRQLSAKADSRNTEKRTPSVRKSGSPSYIENKDESKEQQQQPCVVVSSHPDSFELLKAQGFDDKTATSLAKFPVDRIWRQINHLVIAMDEAKIVNPIGWLRNAIESDWNPPEKKVDPAVEAAELRSKQLEERTRVINECQKLYDEFQDRFQTRKYFDIGLDVLTMRSGEKHSVIPYQEGTIKMLKKFIALEF